MDIHKKVTTLVFVTLMSTNIQAENVGLHLGAHLWNSKPNGAFGEKSNLTRAETDRDQNIGYFIELIHPYQLLPNVRIERTSYDASGQAEFSREYSNDTDIAHVDVLEHVTANTRFNISHVDYTFFYQLFNDEQLSLDLGLTARDYGDGLVYTESADITTTTRDFIWDGPDHDDHDYHNIVEKTQRVNKEDLKVDEIEPMLFFASKIVTPVKGLAFLLKRTIR